MKTVIRIVAVCLTAATLLPAHAQFAKPEDAIKYRKASYTVMAAHFGRLGAMANGRMPYDAKAAAENAELVLTLAKLPWAAYGEGTDKGDTKAKPEIWTDKAKFNEYAEKMQAEMVKLTVAAKTGNLDSIKVAAGAVGGSCKSCHDAFRQ